MNALTIPTAMKAAGKVARARLEENSNANSECGINGHESAKWHRKKPGDAPCGVPPGLFCDSFTVSVRSWRRTSRRAAPSARTRGRRSPSPASDRSSGRISHRGSIAHRSLRRNSLLCRRLLLNRRGGLLRRLHRLRERLTHRDACAHADARARHAAGVVRRPRIASAA